MTRTTTRWTALAAAGGLLLAACGGSDDDAGNDTPAVSVEVTADDAPSGTDAATETTVTSTAAGVAGFPRTVEHGLGEVTVEVQPERIVATADRDQLDVLLAMGVTPVLVGESGDYPEPPPWIDPELLDGVELGAMTDPFTPNLELIAAARPDLIVDAWATDDVQASLEQIAPTVQIKVANETTWQEAQEVAGAATGLDDAAAAAIAETEAVISAESERLADIQDLTVAVAFPSGGSLTIIPGDEIGARILTELGMTVVDTPDGVSGQFSLEETDTLLADADIILSFDYGESAELESNPLFAGLEAVQAGRYVTVPVDVATAVYQESTLSLRWAAPLIADLLLTAAAGEGVQVD